MSPDHTCIRLLCTHNDDDEGWTEDLCFQKGNDGVQGSQGPTGPSGSPGSSGMMVNACSITGDQPSLTDFNICMTCIQCQINTYTPCVCLRWKGPPGIEGLDGKDGKPGLRASYTHTHVPTHRSCVLQHTLRSAGRVTHMLTFCTAVVSVARERRALQAQQDHEESQ